jgi:hypothetical protein
MKKKVRGGVKMSKAVERRMVLRDQVTPTMKKINKSNMKYKSNLKNLRKTGKRTWWSMKRNMMGVVFAGLALAKSVLAIRDMEEAYSRQVEAVAKLEAVFNSTGKASRAQVGSLQTYASELQKVGIIGDEVTISGMQQLATFNVTSDTVKTLSAGMNDLLAQQKGVNATQQDAVNISNMVGKAMMGQVGALSRVGITFSEAQAQVLKYGTESEKAAVMAEVLRQNVGGVNKALAETDVGQIAQVNNTMGDLRETLGQTVVRIKGAFAKAFMDNLPAIEAKVNAVADSINRWVDEGGVDNFIETVGIVKDTLQDLAPVIGLVAYGVGVYKVQAMYAAIAQKGLNAAMMANPVGFVVGALMALVAVIVLVRKHQDTLKLKFMTSWNSISEYAEGGINRMIGGLNSMISGVDYFTSSVEYFFKSMWNSVVKYSEQKIQDWIEPINSVLRFLEKDTIKLNFSAAQVDAVTPTYSKKNYINEIQVKQFSQDKISAIEEARRKKQEKELEDNTKAMAALSESIEGNTDAVSTNTEALKSSSKDMTGEQIADKLMPRLERVVHG